MKLWVDDERLPPDNTWIVCVDADVAIFMLSSYWGYIECISLDNDLGGAMTGEDVMRAIETLVSVDKGSFIPEIKCHSANPVARRRILLAIKRLASLRPSRLRS